MKQILDLIPIVLFVVVYFTSRDIFLSTAVLIGAMGIQVILEYILYRKVEKKTLVVFAIAFLFGGATLMFRDQTFIQWKPTVVNWIFALALLVSQFVGSRNLLERMLTGQLELPGGVWKNLNLGWAMGFFIAGVLNLVVAYNFSLDFWVTYKLVGGFAITFIYIIITIIYLVKGDYLKTE